MVSHSDDYITDANQDIRICQHLYVAEQNTPC
jgi:hypothetical protein